MIRMPTLVTALLCCLLVPLAVGEAATLYGANGAGGNPSSLLILDPATGAVISTVGPIGFAVTGLAVHPVTGVMYGSTSQLSATAPRSLIRVDKTTGQGTLIGSFNAPNHTMADLTFGPDGTLYGWAEPTLDDLHTINLTTGQATRVGESGIEENTLGSGIAATADAIYLAGREANRQLHLVNRTTGVARPVAVLDGQPRIAIAALAFGPTGALFGAGIPVGSGNVLLRIDPATGHVTEIGPTADFLDAIAWDPPTFPASAAIAVPTLSGVAFTAMATLLVGVAMYQVRRRGSGRRSAAR